MSTSAISSSGSDASLHRRAAGPILFSTPVTSPSKLNAGLALYEAGLLGAYHGALGFRSDGAVLATARGIDRMLGLKLGEQLRRRSVEAIPGRLVHFFPWIDLVRTLAARRGLSSEAVAALTRQGLERFDRHVADQVGRFAGVYAFRGAAKASFEAARRHGAVCLYSVGGFDPAYMHALDEAEAARHPDLLADFAGPHASEAELARYDVEWDLADVVIANSKTCLESHRREGLDLAKARVVLLGFPQPCSADEARRGAEGPLRVLWAGGFSVRKGAHYLLQALQHVDQAQFDLRAFGQRQLPREAYARWPAALDVRPTIPRPALMAQYRRAEVVVMPTLADGFGMVISEAMSQGCVVITTERAGAAEFIRSGENGLVVPAADPQGLAAALRWCADHRSELAAMGEQARRTAQTWQWRDYRSAIAGVVAEALETRKRHLAG